MVARRKMSESMVEELERQIMSTEEEHQAVPEAVQQYAGVKHVEAVAGEIAEAPEVGRAVGDALLDYAKQLADHVENVGESILNDAMAFREECKVMAEGFRRSASEKAGDAVEFTRKMRQAGISMSKIKDDFHG